ncbi:serine/threonine-protein kinase UCN [Salvia hispanica]|uniref:serine/threonine-protein kinase UCN n=1 Tax=Salvia hispanica TaxID=49212 RepID=UPI0020095F5A|nr:serine/threonine-protein kinase UCN [Salvia hispanica]
MTNMDSDKSVEAAHDIHLLRAVKVLGKGATGTVFLVHDNSRDSPFALKVVEKSSADRRARHEISLLRRLAPHPFLPHLICSSEDDQFIWWGIPFCPGGDLNALRHRQNDHVFSPAAIRFYLAEILLALRHLHRQGIAYRDLKPENILIQLSGHVTLTDFDLSRDLPPRSTCHTKPKSARVSPAAERSNSFVGTEEYVAPEVIRGDGHDFCVDWWAMGVLAYEMMYGTTPFKGRNRRETFRKILISRPERVGKADDALTDLIGKLLEKDPARRLGYWRGAAEIMEHRFFRGLRWELLTEVVRPPFLPSAEVVGDGEIDITEHFRRMKVPLWSPSDDDVSLTDF